MKKNKLLYIYRANVLKLINNEISGITNTYGRYKHKKYVIGEGEDHKAEYAYDKSADSVKRKTRKTTERKSLGAKYFNLVSGNKLYDEETIIEIYRYAVEYNKSHEGDSYYEDKLKDLDFFKQYSFITDDCLKQKVKKQSDDEDVWGEPDLMSQKDYSMDEIFEMKTYDDVIKNTG